MLMLKLGFTEGPDNDTVVLWDNTLIYDEETNPDETAWGAPGNPTKSNVDTLGILLVKWTSASDPFNIGEREEPVPPPVEEPLSSFLDTLVRMVADADTYTDDVLDVFDDGVYTVVVSMTFTGGFDPQIFYFHRYYAHELIDALNLRSLSVEIPLKSYSLVQDNALMRELIDTAKTACENDQGDKAYRIHEYLQTVEENFSGSIIQSMEGLV